jgi:hypothetical protein
MKEKNKPVPPPPVRNEWNPAPMPFRGPRGEGEDVGVIGFWHHDSIDQPWDRKAKANFLSPNYDTPIKMTSPSQQDVATTSAQAAYDHLKATTYINGIIRVSAVDYNAIDRSPSLRTAFETTCAKAVAEAARTSKENVHVILSSGSVRVEYTISIPSSSSAATSNAFKRALDSNFARDFARAVNAIPDIYTATGGAAVTADPLKPTVKEISQGEYESDWKCKLAVTRAKFADDELGEALKMTGNTYLLEHNPEMGAEDEWSDNFNGEGKNKDGVILMLVRDELTGGKMWTQQLATMIDLETGYVKPSHEARWQEWVRSARHSLSEGTFHTTADPADAEEGTFAKPAVQAEKDELNMAMTVAGWTRIAHTERGKSVCLDLPIHTVRKLAEGGTRVRIQKAGRPFEAVQSKRYTYPITNIARGECIGCGRKVSREEVDLTWTCFNPNRCSIFDRLWHDAIPPSGNDTLFEKCIFDAKENTRGLVWKASAAVSMAWEGQDGPNSSNLEVFIDNVEKPCLKIKVVSTGFGADEKVEYWFNDNKARIATGNGINICMIDPYTEKIVAFWYESRQPDANDRIVNLLDGYPDGTIVLVGVKGSGMEMLNNQAKEALWRCGSTLEVGIEGEGYALIGCKGGFALDERRGAEAADPGASGLIQMCPGLGEQHNGANDIKPTPGNCKDTCKGKKMPELYKGGGSMNHF